MTDILWLINHWFPLIRPAIKPLFLGWGRLGGVGWLAMNIAFCWLDMAWWLLAPKLEQYLQLIEHNKVYTLEIEKQEPCNETLLRV